MMANELLAIVYGLVAMVCFGLANALSKPLSRKFGPTLAIIFRNLAILFFLLLAFPFFVDEANFDLYWFLIGGFVVAVSYLGLFFFYRALEYGDAGVVSPVSSARIVLASLIGIIFLGDELSSLQIVAIAGIFVGLVFLTIDFKKFLKSDFFRIKSGIPYALFAALFWGLTFPFFKDPSVHLGAFFFTIVVEGVVLLCALLQFFVLEKKSSVFVPGWSKLWLLILVVGLTSALASMTSNFGYATGHISIVAALSGSSSFVTVLIGILFFKEKLSLKQFVASVVIVASIVVLSLA